MMPFLIILGAIFFCFLSLLCLILSLKMKISIGYSDEVTLTVSLFGLKVRLLPRKDKKKKRKGPHSMSRAKAMRIRKRAARKAQKKLDAEKAKKDAKKQEKKPSEQEEKKMTASDILNILDLVRVTAAEVVRRGLHHLRVDVARIHVRIATEDAATTAIAYGAACTALNLLIPILSEVKNFSLPREKDFSVEADFLGEKSEIDVELSFSLRVWHFAHMMLAGLIQLLKRLIQRKLKQMKEEEKAQAPTPVQQAKK